MSLRRPLEMPRYETVSSQLYNWKVVRSEMTCLRKSQFGIFNLESQAHSGRAKSLGSCEEWNDS